MRFKRKNNKIKSIKSKPNINLIFKISAAIIIVLVIILAVAFYKDVFLLRRVEVNGFVRSTAIDVISMANIKQNQNIFFIDKDEIKENIERDYLFIVEDISLKPPDMISITIKERHSIALLENEKGLVEITSDKYILKKDSIYNYNLPYLTGFNINLQSDVVEDEHTKYMAQILGDLYENDIDVFNIISEIDGSGVDLIIYPRGYNIKVIAEKYIAKDKFIKLASILTLLKNDDREAIEIDMRFDEAIVKYK